MEGGERQRRQVDDNDPALVEARDASRARLDRLETHAHERARDAATHIAARPPTRVPTMDDIPSHIMRDITRDAAMMGARQATGGAASMGAFLRETQRYANTNRQLRDTSQDLQAWAFPRRHLHVGFRTNPTAMSAISRSQQTRLFRPHLPAHLPQTPLQQIQGVRGPAQIQAGLRAGLVTGRGQPIDRGRVGGGAGFGSIDPSLFD